MNGIPPCQFIEGVVWLHLRQPHRSHVIVGEYSFVDVYAGLSRNVHQFCSHFMDLRLSRRWSFLQDIRRNPRLNWKLSLVNVYSTSPLSGAIPTSNRSRLIRRTRFDCDSLFFRSLPRP